MTDSPEVLDNAADSRFELTTDGHVAVLEYRLDGDRMVLTHTGVPDELEGRGIGGRLVRAAVGEAEAQHLTLVPQCSFAASWLERHPDAAAKVTVEAPG
jgi:uncharacterized protein